MRFRDRPSLPPLSPQQEGLQEVAIEYTMHGWGIVPASACDGLVYSDGLTRRRVAEFAPSLPSGNTVRSARTAHSWYALAPYGIAARAGEDFDVLHAPTWLAVLATGRPEFRRHLCPVALSPSGVSVLVQPGVPLQERLARERGVELAPPGSLVPLPPTRLVGGRVTWWVTPRQVQWRLGDSATVQAAILAALNAASPDGAGGEARA